MTQFVRTFAAFAFASVLVAATAVVALSLRPLPTIAATDPSVAPAAHTISVTASGTVTIVPDVVDVTLGINASRPTVEAARAQAAKVMNAIVAATKKLGVDDKDIQTVNVNLSPQYASGSQARIVGYTMSEQVRITVRDIDKAGSIVDASTAAGANTVDGLVFDVADPAKARDDARVAAVAAARTRATAMAQAAGVSLGAVFSITDVSVGSPVPYYGAASLLRTAGSATQVLPGTQDLDAQVTVVFEIH
jgi:uncharacterized protein YggE